MTGAVMNLLVCPFCKPGSGRISADLTAIRTVENRVDSIDLGSDRHPAVLFDSDAVNGVPCTHLVDLALFLGWESFTWRGASRPGGSIQADWIHPAAIRAGWSRIVTLPSDGVRAPDERHPSTSRAPSRNLSAHLVGVFRGPPGDLAWFVDPNPDAESPARPGEESGWWWADADAVFAADPEVFVEESMAMVDAG